MVGRRRDERFFWFGWECCPVDPRVGMRLGCVEEQLTCLLNGDGSCDETYYQDWACWMLSCHRFWSLSRIEKLASKQRNIYGYCG